MNAIRIVEFPKCRAVTSGYATAEAPFEEGGTLLRFMAWWNEYDRQRVDRWFPRDFIMFGREENAIIWFYMLPDGEQVCTDYEIIDFEGGLYAAATAVDSDFDDEQRVYGEIKAWVIGSGAFALDERRGHYDMCHVITPQCARKAMGHAQLEIFVPIKIIRED